MISLSEVYSLLRKTQCINYLKPCWDHLIDQMMICCFLMNVLCWSRITDGELERLICVPLKGNTSNLAITEGRYWASRCEFESSAKFLINFPYILFVQWVCLYLLQSAWTMCPTIFDKLMIIHKIISDIRDLEPSFDSSFGSCALNFLPSIEFDSVMQDKIDMLSDRLILFMREPTRIYYCYVSKLILTVIFSTVFLHGQFLTNFYDFFQPDFECNLSNPNASVILVQNYACSASLHLYIFMVIVVQVMILICLLLFSLYALYWCNNDAVMFNRHPAIYDSLKGFYGLPGFKDLKLCIALLSLSLHDGGFSINIIDFVLKNCNSQAVFSQKNLPYKEKIIFIERFRVINHIAAYVGLKIVENKQNYGHLFQILESVRKFSDNIDLELIECLKSKIAKEMKINSPPYRTAWEQLYDHSRRKISDVFESDPYLEHVENMYNERIWCDRLVLLAAANVLSCKIILLSAEVSDSNLFSTTDYFIPMHDCDNKNVIIMAHIPPYHYFNVKTLQNVSNEVLLQRRLFENSCETRNTIRIKLQRHILPDDEESYQSENQSFKSDYFLQSDSNDESTESLNSKFLPSLNKWKEKLLNSKITEAQILFYEEEDEEQEF